MVRARICRDGIETLDPNKHNLEIIYLPLSKGNPKWQQPANQIFLGIDHTAIVISNTVASLKFYRALLGLKLAGESMNYGHRSELGCSCFMSPFLDNP